MQAAWHVAMARLAQDRGDARSALRWLNRHLNAPGHDAALDATAYALRASLHTQAGRHQTAAANQAARLADSASPEVEHHLALAQAHERAGQRHDALAAITAGQAQLGPLLVLRQWALEFEVRQRQWPAALAVLDSLVTESPRREGWLLRRAEVHALAGQGALAQEDIAAALQAWQQLPAGVQATPAMVALRQRMEAVRQAVQMR